jgi:hypothetical protein
MNLISRSTKEILAERRSLTLGVPFICSGRRTHGRARIKLEIKLHKVVAVLSTLEQRNECLIWVGEIRCFRYGNGAEVMVTATRRSAEAFMGG